MFDLMEAVRKRQQEQHPHSARETFSAENPQLSAKIRNDQKAVNPLKLKGSHDFSANPQNPQARDTKKQNAEALILDIAKTLRADAHMLRALLSDDDMQAIAEGCPGYERDRLIAYFKRMEADGKSLYDLNHHLRRLETISRQKTYNTREQEQAWRAAHGLFINHIMACSDCRAPLGRYCHQGQILRRNYLTTYRACYPLLSVSITNGATNEPG
jgi:hypothetical protein